LHLSFLPRGCSRGRMGENVFLESVSSSGDSAKTFRCAVPDSERCVSPHRLADSPQPDTSPSAANDLNYSAKALTDLQIGALVYGARKTSHSELNRRHPPGSIKTESKPNFPDSKALDSGLWAEKTPATFLPSSRQWWRSPVPGGHSRGPGCSAGRAQQNPDLPPAQDHAGVRDVLASGFGGGSMVPISVL
jgi:hypothetical protein